MLMAAALSYVSLLSQARKEPSPWAAKLRTPPESYMSLSWTQTVLRSNEMFGAIGERGVIYSAVGTNSLEKAFRSARSVRRWNPPAMLKLLLVTDSTGRTRAKSWSLSKFDYVIDVGESSAKLRYADMEEYEGFKTRNEIVLRQQSDKKDGASRRLSSSSSTNRLSKRGLSLKRLRIIKVRSLMLGSRLFRTIVFLDTDTAICSSLLPLFESIDIAKAEVAFVEIPGAHAHAQDLVNAAFGVPRDFPEANTGVLVVRNSSRTRSLLANWNVAYHALARRDEHLMDQPAFRVALYKSSIEFVALDRAYNCRGRDRITKTALPLACGGLVQNDENADCIILHSHDVTPDSAAGPTGLPNFYLSRSKASLYQSAPTVFLHIPKAAGNSVKLLFVKNVLVNHRRRRTVGNDARLEQSLHIDTRREWDNGNQRASALVLYGAFAFGACSTHPLKPCAHYVIFRDPIARLASEFKYCKSAEVDFSDQCCTGRQGTAHMRRIQTLADWAEERGNFMLEHLVHLSDVDWADRAASSSSRPFTEWHSRNSDSRINPIETRRAREGPANVAHLDLALANLDQWFAVIGLTERYDESLALFSYALTGTVLSRHVASSVWTHKQTHDTSKAPLVDFENNTLSRIKQAVALDAQLYAAAVRLFERQVAAFKSSGLDFV